MSQHIVSLWKPCVTASCLIRDTELDWRFLTASWLEQHIYHQLHRKEVLKTKKGNSKQRHMLNSNHEPLCAQGLEKWLRASSASVAARLMVTQAGLISVATPHQMIVLALRNMDTYSVIFHLWEDFADACGSVTRLTVTHRWLVFKRGSLHYIRWGFLRDTDYKHYQKHAPVLEKKTQNWFQIWPYTLVPHWTFLTTDTEIKTFPWSPEVFF